MINEFAAHIKEGITMSIRIAKETHNITKAIKQKIGKDFEGSMRKLRNSKGVPLKALYKKGQLQEIEVSKGELKELKNNLIVTALDFQL